MRNKKAPGLLRPGLVNPCITFAGTTRLNHEGKENILENKFVCFGILVYFREMKGEKKYSLVKVDPIVHKSAKVHCARENISLSAFFSGAAAYALIEHSQKKKKAK